MSRTADFALGPRRRPAKSGHAFGIEGGPLIL